MISRNYDMISYSARFRSGGPGVDRDSAWPAGRLSRATGTGSLRLRLGLGVWETRSCSHLNHNLPTGLSQWATASARQRLRLRLPVATVLVTPVGRSLIKSWSVLCLVSLSVLAQVQCQPLASTEPLLPAGAGPGRRGRIRVGGS
jgi:hypothetical protein